jgi:fatty acid desaturase
MPTSNAVGIHWYRTSLDKETLRSLTRRSDARALIQMLVQLIGTAGLGAGVYWLLITGRWLPAVPAYWVYCTVFSFLGLSGAGHELCHRTPFRTRWLNEAFLRLTSFLTWTDFVHFRASHAGHHQYTVHDQLDLEVILPLRVRRRDWVWMLTLNVPLMIGVLKTTVRRARGRLEGEWEHRIFPESSPDKRRQLARWARVLLVGHAVLIAVFVATGQWPLLLLVSLAPFVAGWLNFLCGFTQHIGLPPNVPDFRICCRTMTLNPLLAFLYWQMNYHVEHHMYAAVPFYNLRRLRRTLAADLPPAHRGLWATWRHIFAVMRRQRRDPSYAHWAELPPTATAVPSTEGRAESGS